MRVLAFLIFIILPQILLSQYPDWDEFSFEESPDILAMECDSLGLLWICTDHELFSFDGLELKSVFSFEEEVCKSFRKNKMGLFCIGTNEGSVLSFNPYTRSSKIIKDHSDFKDITSVCLIDEENYLLASYGKGLLLSINGREEELTFDESLMSNELYDIEWYQGKYYISTDQGIQVISISEKEFLIDQITIDDGLPDLVITHLEASGNKLWFTDYRKNVGWIKEDGSIKNYPSTGISKIHDLLIEGERTFIANDDGLFQIVSGEWVKKYPVDGKHKVEHVQIDKEENLWLKSANNSLSKGNLTFQKYLTGFENARAIAKIDTMFLVGNETGLYLQVGGESRKINNKNITFLALHENYLMVGTFSEGILVYDKQLRLVDQKNQWMGISRQSVLSIVSVDKEIYVSSLSGVMKFKLNKSKLHEVESINSKIGRDYIYTIFQSGEHLYFGTDRNGLIKWAPNSNSVQKIKTFDDGEKIGSVFSITEDTEGIVWFSTTQKGLGSIKEGSVDYLSTQANPNEDYATVSRLSDDRILLVSEGSVGLLNPRNKEIIYFNQNLESLNEVGFLNAIVQDSVDTYFVHHNNILVYKPGPNLKDQPGVSIDKVLVNLIPVKDKTEFSEDECNVEFNYNGIWLSDPNKVKYQYKLEGFNEEWRETRNKTVAFPKLIPGKYTFNLKASHNSNFSNAVPAVYAFEIKPYWYNLGFVRLLFLLLAGLLLGSMYKYRDKQRKEKQALEQLKVKNQLTNLKNQLNPHFLFNSFNTLIGLIEEDKPNSVAFVERMSDFYRSMLELGKKDMVSLNKEMELLALYLDILKTRFDGQLLIESNVDELEGFTIPPFTLQILVENAVKHNVVSTKSPLRIKIEMEGSALKIWNSKNQLINPSKGTKTGLENITRRFSLAGLSEPIIINLDDSFEVCLKLKKV